MDSQSINPDLVAEITQALELTHDPRTPNETRVSAFHLLQKYKESREGPIYGLQLSSDRSKAPVVRHFGLSLLEEAISHRWHNYSPDETQTMRQWVFQLCSNISMDDPAHLRNKCAQLWVELAKRSWLDTWLDMDKMLLGLWTDPDPCASKELVLSVLESLSDEVFNSEDASIVQRETSLGRACMEIFTPSSVIDETYPNRRLPPDIRSDADGWLVRITKFLKECLAASSTTNAFLNDPSVRLLVIKCLSVMSSLTVWIVPRTIIAADGISVLIHALSIPNVEIQQLALNAFAGLYSRTNFGEADSKALFSPMFEVRTIGLMRDLYNYSKCDATDIDMDKYTFAKKFSEVLSCIGSFFDARFFWLPPNADKDAFFNLLLLVVQDESLVISIPILVIWSRILSRAPLGALATANPDICRALLEVCSVRQLQYEHLPEDCEDPSYLFLLEDTENPVERNLFVGNYRRYSLQVIEALVLLETEASFNFILSRSESMLTHLYDHEPAPTPETYRQYSFSALSAGAQLAVVEAALRGYSRAITSLDDTPGGPGPRPKDFDSAALENYLEKWGEALMNMPFVDPSIRKRVLQLLVTLSTTALEHKDDFMLKVLNHILSTWPPLRPEFPFFNEALKELQAENLVELQRFAMKIPNDLIELYEQIESRVHEILASGTVDTKRAVAYRGFLFIIIHRATSIPYEPRIQRLKAFTEPVVEEWRNPQLLGLLNSFEGFSQLMALDKTRAYLARKRIHELKEWGDHALDAEGLALQAELEERQSQVPLRSTKSFMGFSVDRVDRKSIAWQATQDLWPQHILTVLPPVLQFLSYAHKCHSPEGWPEFSEEARPVYARVLNDRFWQSGISEGSKQDFYVRVLEKRTTLEGLCSSYRGAVRFVREAAYSMLYCFSRFERQFYSFTELPQALAKSLFEDSLYLSSHQQLSIINSVRYMAFDCPVDQRDHFLPVILEQTLRQMDHKITAEWEHHFATQDTKARDDELTEEMKQESTLRQYTYAAIVLVADLLDATRRNNRPTDHGSGKGEAAAAAAAPPRKYRTLRHFCLADQRIAEPLLVFAAHAIRMRDNRCCSLILRVLKSLVPEFRSVGEPVVVPYVNGRGARDEAGDRGPGGGDEEDDDDVSPTEDSEDQCLVDTSPLPSDMVVSMREYMSSEILKACVSSYSETYFVDLQRDLAALIAMIIVNYGTQSSTAARLMLTIPGVSERELNSLGEFMGMPDAHPRQQRNLVIDMLVDVKGVHVAELGKLESTTSKKQQQKKNERSKLLQSFMKAPTEESTPRHASDEAIADVSKLFE